jgi:hypothetical protein
MTFPAEITQSSHGKSEPQFNQLALTKGFHQTHGKQNTVPNENSV